MATSGVGPAGPSGLWLSRALCASWRSSKSFPVACNLSDNKKLQKKRVCAVLTMGSYTLYIIQITGSEFH